MKDIFGHDMTSLADKRLFLFDMDGTVYLGNILFDGIKELLERIYSIGGRYVFVTNNSSKGKTEYVSKLRGMGIETSEDDFFTSLDAAAVLLKEKHPGSLVYLQGTDAMRKEMERHGIRTTVEETAEADCILVGFDTELTFDKLVRTVKMLKYPIPYYAANPDLVCPTEYGSVPDCGSMCAALKNAAGREPFYIGKPRPDMILLAAAKYGYGIDETIVIGDRLYTDIASGIAAGTDTVCVLTGEAVLEDVINTENKPTYVIESAAELLL